MFLVQWLEAKPITHEVRDTFGSELTYARTLFRREKAVKIPLLKIYISKTIAIPISIRAPTSITIPIPGPSAIVIHCPGFN